MFYNSNCINKEVTKKQCYKIIGEFYIYPSYYEEENNHNCNCGEAPNYYENNNNYNFSTDNCHNSCNKTEEKHTCKNTNRCCCFKRWWC